MITLRFAIQDRNSDRIAERARERVASYFGRQLSELTILEWSEDVHPFVHEYGGSVTTWEADFTVVVKGDDGP